MKPGRQSIQDISRMWNDEILKGQSLSLWLLGDLLDDFRLRCSTPEEKLADDVKAVRQVEPASCRLRAWPA